MTEKAQQAEGTVDYDITSTAPEAFDRTLNHARKAHAILSVAAQAFVEKGYNQTALADIVDRLKISKPTLYYYVGNKEEILFKCQLAALDHLKEELAKVAEQNLSGLDALKQFMLRVGEWISSEFARCIARCHVDLLNPKAREEILAGRRMIDRAVRDIIERGIRDGSIRKCNPQTTTAALFGAFNWMAHWYDPKRASISSREIGEDFMFVFIRGLSADNDKKRAR